MSKKSKMISLLHGTPAKLDVGDYLDPKYAGIWETFTEKINPATDTKEKCMYFIRGLWSALFYASREIYQVSETPNYDRDKEILHFLFKDPNYQTYVYNVQIPEDKLHHYFADKNGNYTGGEAVCFEPVKIIGKEVYDIERYMKYYSENVPVGKLAKPIKTQAHVLKPSDNPLIPKSHVPHTFGNMGGNTSCTDEQSIKRFHKDLKEYSTRL